MKVCVIFAVLSSAFLGCTCTASRECPSEWFDVSFSIIIDMVAPRSAVASSIDSDLRHFKETLKFTNEEIEKVTQQAFEFYSKSYGLDFSNSPVDTAGRRQFENATMFPFEAPFDLPVSHNRWVINGRKGSNRCFYMREGGYGVNFSGTQILRGTYGGKEGTPLPPSADQLTYVLFSLNVCLQQPTVITCTSPQPSFRNPHGYATRIGDCYNRELGHGLLQGVQGIVPTEEDPDLIHLIVRHVLTFPPHPL